MPINRVNTPSQDFSRDINTTHSTCLVPGNKSAPQILLIEYPFCERNLASRAAVEGLQEIIMILVGEAFKIADRVSSEQPFLGGSTIIILGFSPLVFNSVKTSPASPQ